MNWHLNSEIKIGMKIYSGAIFRKIHFIIKKVKLLKGTKNLYEINIRGNEGCQVTRQIYNF